MQPAGILGGREPRPLRRLPEIVQARMQAYSRFPDLAAVAAVCLEVLVKTGPQCIDARITPPNLEVKAIGEGGLL